MNNSTPAFKRVRPALGTFLEITLYSIEERCHEELNSLMTKCFEMAQDLEEIFSFFMENSEISKLNRLEPFGLLQLSSHADAVLQTAQFLWRASNQAFSPFRGPSPKEFPFERLTAPPMTWRRKNSCESPPLDLNGLAKGYIVDQMSEFMINNHPTLSGLVNAGGDGRFFGKSPRQIQLRLGEAQSPLLRQWQIPRSAFASSSPSVSIRDPLSTTHYFGKLNENLDSDFTVCVSSSECLMADALTKVGLMASHSTLQSCARLWDSQVLIFDSQGSLCEELSVI